MFYSRKSNFSDAVDIEVGNLRVKRKKELRTAEFLFSREYNKDLEKTFHNQIFELQCFSLKFIVIYVK